MCGETLAIFGASFFVAAMLRSKRPFGDRKLSQFWGGSLNTAL